MAVSKLEKVSLFVKKEKQDALLHQIQNLSSLQLIDLQESPYDFEKFSKFISGNQLSESKQSELYDEKSDFLQEIQKAILFIEGNSKKRKGEKISTAPKREELSFLDFHQKVDTEKISQVLAQTKEYEQLLESLSKERIALNTSEQLCSKLKKLDVSIEETKKMKYFDTFLMKVDVKNSEYFLENLNEKEVYFEELFGTKQENYYFILCKKELKEEMTTLFSAVGAHIVEYKYSLSPKEQLHQILTRQEAVVKEIESVKESIYDLREELVLLKYAEEFTDSQLSLEKEKDLLWQTKHFMLFTAFIPVKQKRFLTQMIQNQFPNQVYTAFESIQDGESSEGIPTLLENNKLVEPFEMLTSMYSLPKYREIDPTPFMTPFYLIFFGMMVADVGYGLLMLIGTVAALKVTKFPRSVAKFLRFFCFVSIPTILWGLVYGSCFGVDLPFRLLSTSKDVNTILILSLVFGFLQIVTGLILGGVSLLKQKEYLASANQSFAWLSLLFGLLFVLLGKMVVSSSLLASIGIFLAIIGAVTIVFVPVITSKQKFAGLASGLFDLYGATSYIGDLVSYTRLMALGISGGSIAAAFNLLVDFMPPVAKFSIGIILLLLLHALNMFLSLLGGYVHAARLQYVEFFGKFYQGGGKEFRPLQPTEKYVLFKRKTE